MTVDKLLREARYLCGLSPQTHPALVTALVHRVHTLHCAKRPLKVLNLYTAWGGVEAGVAVAGKAVALCRGLCMSNDAATQVNAMMAACECQDHIEVKAIEPGALLEAATAAGAEKDLALVVWPQAEEVAGAHGEIEEPQDLVFAAAPLFVAVIGSVPLHEGDGREEHKALGLDKHYTLVEALPYKTGGYKSPYCPIYIFRRKPGVVGVGAGAGAGDRSAW